MKSVMKHDFSRIPHADIPRSTFDRSHGHKTTFSSGQLIPFLIDEALPGDTFASQSTIFARMATPIFPIMDNLYMDTHFFAVPYRLVWDNWEKFNGAQDNPGDSTDYLLPMMSSPDVTGYAEESIHDYMGIPPGVPNLEHSCLWHRAYSLIYNDWFRDENLIDSLPVPKDDGPDDPALYSIKRRGKRHDYFTAALPWPQKGDSVQVPIGDRANIELASPGTTGAVSFLHAGDGQTIPSQAVSTDASSLMIGQLGSAPGVIDPNGSLYADLSTAVGATINELRQSFQIQKMLERDARGGTRYTELVKSHFGVTSPDARLQRPEYLGGSSGPISMQQVPSTVPTELGGATPQGNLAAYATHTSHKHGFTKSFTEHCLIIGLVSVRADLNYQQGLPRMFSRQTRFDMYWPALSHLGEQTILQKELFASGIPAEDDIVFGYQERHAEYRYKNSSISGKFRSQSTAPLDAWHLAQDFANAPVLDEAFINETPPVDRVIAVPSEPEFIFDSYTKMHCARPMPVYGVPGLIDHF